MYKNENVNIVSEEDGKNRPGAVVLYHHEVHPRLGFAMT